MTDSAHPPSSPRCAHEDCEKAGLYRAPKDRSGQAFLWFCLEHVRAYNAKWNAFEGYTPEEIERHIRNATVWERPTWPFGKGPMAARKKAAGSGPRARSEAPPETPALREALAVLGLAPPVALATVKKRYRSLAKTYHPDANAGSAAQIGKFHRLQQAFATIRAAYAKQDQGQKKTKRTKDS